MNNVTTVGIDLAKNVFFLHGVNDQGREVVRRTVRLMAPKFVTPYRRGGKNDGNDAEAICEAVARPSMRFVPVKSADQQAVLALHRVRQGFVEERTATLNRIRGLLAEFGHVLPQRAVEVRRRLPALLEQLPPLAARALGDLQAHVRILDQNILDYERELARLGAPAVLHRRQDAPRAHHPTGRSVPAHPAHHGSTNMS